MWSTSYYVDPEGMITSYTLNTFGHDDLQRAHPDWRGPFLSLDDIPANIGEKR